MGNTIEFRTTLEVSYQLKNKNRLGLSFGHISNANIGDKNPGVEIISLSYQIPFEWNYISIFCFPINFKKIDSNLSIS